MLFPPLLVSGCRVAVAASARRIRDQDLEEGLARFRAWNLQFEFAPALSSPQHSYLAGTDDERRRDLQFFLDRSDLSAILCARGGYGTTRIIDQLDFTAFRRHPKWIIGFSDVTALHLRLQREEIASIHGSMPIQFRSLEHHESLASLVTCAFEGQFRLSADVHQRNRQGIAQAFLTGGNLSLVVDSLGTRDEIQTAGKILLLEEIDEYHYKLDRMLVHLRRAGKLDHLAGLAIGHLTDMKETELPFGETCEEIVRHHVSQFSYPVAFGLPFGHAVPNRSWIVGAKAELQVTANGTTLTAAG